ncbi:MAG: aldehyde ferredoxin oxidoreductase family protein [Candidatus Methylomirabilales bacterium]
MSHGYMGQVLRVDLSVGQATAEPLNREWAQKYVGGSGLATRYLYDAIDAATRPDNPRNPLIFMTGPLGGTRSLTSGRHHVVGLSPLTGIFGESDCGGSWGDQLKQAGFDGIVITGKSPRPVYLWVADGRAELREGSRVWGTDPYEVDALLKAETDPGASVACVGTAAERGALIAGILHEGPEGRAAGRCGLGALMASKRLKAVVVRGTGRVAVADDAGLKALVQRYAPLVSDRLKDMRKYGTARMVQASEHLGSMPLQNFKYPHRWEEGAARISGPAFAERAIVKAFYCGRCVIGCGNVVHVKAGPYRTVEGGGPEYETINLIGANCLVDNLEAICLANELCNRYGLDTMDVGNLVAFAIEAFEMGLITEADTGGVRLQWGSADVVIELIRMIGEGRHIGGLLAQGMARAARAIGGGADEIAMHVKGLTIPAHDPRAYNGLACSYATSNRGAHHTSGQTHVYEHRLEVPEIGHKPMGRFVVEGKGALAALTQHIMNVLDSAKSCKFAQNGGWTIGPVSEAVRLVTGREDTLEDLLRHGERSFNLKRLINVDRGISRKDDTLPRRLLTLPKTAPGYTPNLPPLDVMLDEHYRVRGWSADGIPLPETIQRLEIP